MLPPEWHELAPLVDTILDTPREQRAAMLTEVSGADSGRRSALEWLVAECERPAPLLDEPAVTRFDQLLDDPEEVPLPEVLSDRYKMGRELGRGGMARVYLARDLKHSRDVALKVIRPELAASLGRELFLREIATAAHLRHPNIVPLYDSGDDGGALYFVMPFEPGHSLRDKLQLGPLATTDALSALRDVARALAYAHEQGVVHRDVKPDNVMLSGGTAVVTDFGIARAIRAAQAETAALALTQTSVIGTPAYMAPEQAAGDPTTDHRADIYSFGCMAYELFAGKPPFQAHSVDELIIAHAVAVPRPVSELRAGVPAAAVQLIARCLEKRPEARPQSAVELIAALDSIATAADTSVRRSRPLRAFAVVPVIVAAGLAVAGYLVLSRREEPTALAASGPVTIAVLPLRSVGSDSTQALLAEGLSGEIATALVKVPWVRVMSRSGVSNYRGQRDIDYRQTSRDLGARVMLTGSMRAVNGHEIVALQLIGADGGVLWADRFDRPSAELEAERNEIARSAAEALRPFAGATAGAVLGAQHAAGPAEHHTSGEAYFRQVQAQQWLDRRGQNVRSSADYFRRAIAIDPLYARAYSGLSLALALYPYFQNTPATDVHDELTRAAQRALQLDATLAQPHIALGLAYQHNLQWDRAEAEFTTALRLDSHDVEARVQYGRHLLVRGRTTEALGQFQAAREDDPASALVLSWVSYAYYIEGEQDSARVISDRALQSNALNFTSVVLGSLVRLGNGQREEARQLLAHGPQNFPTTMYVLAVTEDASSTRQRLQSLPSRRPAPWMMHTTRAYAMMGHGDTARALDELEQATNGKEIWPSIQPTTDRMFDGVRGSARFRDLLERVGLADVAKATLPLTVTRR